MKATPTENKLTMRAGGFATLVEALEYAAQGDTGFNFYGGNGQLQEVLTYTLMKNKAQAIAGRLRALGLERGARVERGDLLGVIKFGSRVDLLLPPGYKIEVAPGDRVRAGLTPMARRS